MYNMNVMKGILCKWLGISVFLLVLLFCTQKTEAAVYTDSLTFKIDSAKIEGDFLEYSVMFWRTNESWVGDNGIQDTLLGNTDLNFWLEDVVFDKNVAPQIVRKHADLDLNTAGGLCVDEYRSPLLCLPFFHQGQSERKPHEQYAGGVRFIQPAGRVVPGAFEDDESESESRFGMGCKSYGRSIDDRGAPYPCFGWKYQTQSSKRHYTG